MVDYRLAVISKSPELGRVKTRMQPHLSQKQSVMLHTAMTEYVLSEWLQQPIEAESFSYAIDVHIGGDQALFKQVIYDPLISPPQMSSESESLPPVPPRAITMQAQVDGDLGDRMFAALLDAKAKSTEAGAILVGTDCPFIDTSYLSQAMQMLTEHDLVIGPANDGGYVLLGLSSKALNTNNIDQYLFKDIPWGTDKVLDITLQRIEQTSLSVATVDPVPDIDIVDDLAQLAVTRFPKVLQNFASLHP